MGEYIDLSVWKDAHKQFNAGLAEAAVLISHKPLKKMEFKGTLIYTHFIPDIKSLVVEAYGTYTLGQALKISAGKYLTPLSPVNQYFYAPMNPGVSLPMLVSHHFLLPQSISGLQLSGTLGTNFLLGYNLTYGNCLSVGHYSVGIAGVQGIEEAAVYADRLATASPVYKLGGSGRLYANYNDLINIGLNYFDGRNSVMSITEVKSTGTVVTSIPTQRYTYGIDAQIKFGRYKFNGEFWQGRQKTLDLADPIKNSYSGYYAELIYERGILSPYLRYDKVNDLKATAYLTFPTSKLYSVEYKTDAITVGLAVRPIYEILIKLEYRYVNNNIRFSDQDVPTLTAMNLDPNDPVKVRSKSFNYIAASLVYSF